MKWSKLLKQPPREIAQQVLDHLERGPFSLVELAGPGFINLTLSKEFLSKHLNESQRDPHLGVGRPFENKRVSSRVFLAKYCQRDACGPFAIHNYWRCPCPAFRVSRIQCHCLNHVGDWGTAFGMLIAYMQKEAPEVLSGKKETDLPTLMGWYKASKARFDADEAFKTESRLAVVKLQGGDPEALRAWEIICEVSRKAFEEVYAILDIKLTERGESFYNPMLPEIVADLEKKGLVTISDGAKCVFHEGIRIPLMVSEIGRRLQLRYD